jgi:hypothetical protein
VKEKYIQKVMIQCNQQGEQEETEKPLANPKICPGMTSGTGGQQPTRPKEAGMKTEGRFKGKRSCRKQIWLVKFIFTFSYIA